MQQSFPSPMPSADLRIRRLRHLLTTMVDRHGETGPMVAQIRNNLNAIEAEIGEPLTLPMSPPISPELLRDLEDALLVELGLARVRLGNVEAALERVRGEIKAGQQEVGR